jgi:hypothetical protein
MYFNGITYFQNVPVSMKTITLMFRSFNDLWEFKQMTNTNNFKINSVQLTLTAEFNEAQIDLAISTFKAVVIENKVA